MKTTSNLGLFVSGTTESDLAQSFLDWRLKVCGEGGDSNMEKIDAAYSALTTQINNVSKSVTSLSNSTATQLAAVVKTINSIKPDANGNVALTAASVGARPSTWTPTFADVGGPTALSSALASYVAKNMLTFSNGILTITTT